jgi:hypothetical protein
MLLPTSVGGKSTSSRAAAAQQAYSPIPSDDPAQPGSQRSQYNAVPEPGSPITTLSYGSTIVGDAGEPGRASRSPAAASKGPQLLPHIGRLVVAAAMVGDTTHHNTTLIK